MTTRKAYIIGYGMTPFGEYYEKTGSELAAKALTDALSHSKINRKDIQTIYFGSMVLAADQSSLGHHCSAECGISSSFTHIQGGNASGAAAFHQAYLAIQSGLYDCIAVIGVDKLSDYIKNGMVEKLLAQTIDYTWEYEMGATLTSLYALLTKAHMKEFGTTIEQLAQVPVKNHKNGSNNPKAQFRREIKKERFLKAKRIADPIGRYDPATYGDGSAALILASEDFVNSYSNDLEIKIPVLASTNGSDRLALHHRDTLTSMNATKLAAKLAYSKANIEPKDIQIAEVHDAYPIGEILAIEDLGFFEKGQGGKATEEGLTEISGTVSVNTSGGLKARGDVFGATGIAQIIEIVEQMLGIAGKRQVDTPRYGLTQNVFGTGALSYVHIFGENEVKK
ncbi:MAG: thiolase C-terminal domain-containing protein [Candidatus Heimdallarchaeaceae archaeon]